MALADPAVIVLDEATSSLDPATEAAVEQALAAVVAGRTVIIIAHRLSTAERADRVVVMDHGRVVEVASHDDLVEQGERYARLWASWQAGIAAGNRLKPPGLVAARYAVAMRQVPAPSSTSGRRCSVTRSRSSAVSTISIASANVGIFGLPELLTNAVPRRCLLGIYLRPELQLDAGRTPRSSARRTRSRSSKSSIGSSGG